MKLFLSNFINLKIMLFFIFDVYFYKNKSLSYILKIWYINFENNRMFELIDIQYQEPTKSLSLNLQLNFH